MLLADLLQHPEGPPCHADRPALVEALELVSAVAAHVDESMSNFRDGMLPMRSLYDEIEGLDRLPTRPARRLLRRGLLEKFDRRGNRLATLFLLFDDSMIYARASSPQAPRR